MHGDDAGAIAVGQCRTVEFGQLGRGGTGGRDVRPLVDVVGHLVDAVAQIDAVDQHVQRNLPDPPPLQFIRTQPGRRVGHHRDGHGQPPESTVTTPASARPFIIRIGHRSVGLEVPVDAVGIAAAADDLVPHCGLEVDDRHVVLAVPTR